MKEYDLIALLKIAEDSAAAAGKFLAQKSSLLMRIRKEINRDVKIEADFQSENIIIDSLEKKSAFSILSEERGLIRRKDDAFLWVIDPLDGSLNYSRGMPLCCVSIGLWKKDEPLIGAVYDFNRKEMFLGITGKGAWLNSASIQVSKIRKKEGGILCSGFPVKTDFSKKKIAAHIEDIRVFRKIRLLGTAALSIAYVACGRADVYHENDIMLWDVAGGIPIILGAGGRVDIFKKTEKQHGYNVYLSNGIIN